MKAKYIIITGGAGFIGSHLTERLIQEGYHVVVIDDLSTGSLDNLVGVKSSPKLDIIISRISSCIELPRLIRESSFIFHLAATVGVELAVGYPLQTLLNNVIETEYLLRLATIATVPVFLASSSEVYGRSSKDEFTEDDELVIGPPYASRWGYACSKLLDEFLALAYFREYRLPVIIGRIFNTVGPRQTGRYGMVMPRFIEAALKNQPLRVFGDGKQRRCFCYIEDTVEMMYRLMLCQNALGQIVNIGSTNEISILELAQKIKETLSSQSIIEFVPYQLAYPPGFEDMQRRRPNLEKLKRLIGFIPSRPLEEIILLTAHAIKKQIFSPDRS